MSIKVLSFHFTAYNEDGTVNDTSEDGEVVSILTEHGYILPILEDTLLNMQVNTRQNVLVTPNEGFGDIDPDKKQEFSKKVFTDENLEVGMVINMATPEGDSVLGIIHEIKPETVIIDFNHPLAGKTLKFDLNLLGIREATEEELDHGHAHDGDGHHHH